MKSSMSFSKKTLFSHSVSSASISSVLRFISSKGQLASRFPNQCEILVYQPKRVLRDQARGVRASHGSPGLLHCAELFRLVHKRRYFPRRRRKIVAADRRPRFQQMIGVALFLAGDRLAE